MGNNSSWTRTCSHILALVTLRHPAFWQRSWRHRAARLAIYAAVAYLGILLGLLGLEDFFLFGPRNADMVKPPPGIEVQNVEMTSRLGDRIHAWWSTPKDWRPEQGALLFCHGNGGNLSYRGSALPHWLNEMNVAVLLFDYPGFGLSTGEPSEQNCCAAGDAAYEWLCDNPKAPAERIILYGGSLGGGIATDLASRRPHRALVLVASFSSFPDMAQTRYPWLPGRWLVHNRFDNLGKIANCRGPVFIAHGTRDGLIPVTHAERLFAAAAKPKRLFSMIDYPHIDLPCDAFYPTLRDFLAECERPAN
jgi:uncharacterized protein